MPNVAGEQGDVWWDSDPADALPVATGDTLFASVNLGTVTKLHRRSAVVAHVSRGGTGLMMESYSARFS